jgi:hypothetical protein
MKLEFMYTPVQKIDEALVLYRDGRSDRSVA